mmetsp:Transcript_17817/g.54475  ORF Transcript_17817/g.54475 Transcript_17817/m.54475 type:complete len:135 (-) Transcript_17817:230-634(-)
MCPSGWQESPTNQEANGQEDGEVNCEEERRVDSFRCASTFANSSLAFFALKNNRNSVKTVGAHVHSWAARESFFAIASFLDPFADARESSAVQVASQHEVLRRQGELRTTGGLTVELAGSEVLGSHWWFIKQAG